MKNNLKNGAVEEQEIELDLEQSEKESGMDNQENDVEDCVRGGEPCGQDFEVSFAPADSFDASKVSDRFACAEDLAKAYRHLRAEFTRKCQRIGELERQVQTANAGAAESNSAGENARVQVKNETLQGGPAVILQKQSAAEHRGGDKVMLPPLSQAGSDKIIEEYLLLLASSKKAPAVISSSGVDFIQKNQHEVRSLNVSTKLAEDFFSSRR